MKHRPDASSGNALTSPDRKIARRLKELRAIGKDVRSIGLAPTPPGTPELAQLRAELDEQRAHTEDLARRLDAANAALGEAEAIRAREAARMRRR